MQTRVLLLRHAESTHPHVFNGAESDVPLSLRGHRQAAALRSILAAWEPDVVVSSAMQRALQTARPIAAACAAPLHIEPNLHERKVGEMSGKTNDETGGMWTETLRRWKDGEVDFATPGAESFLALQRRTLGVWDRIVKEHADRTVVVVAHGHVCRALLLSLLPGLSVAGWEELGPIRNASLTELVRAGEVWQCIRLAEVPAAVEAVSGAD